MTEKTSQTLREEEMEMYSRKIQEFMKMYNQCWKELTKALDVEGLQAPELQILNGEDLRPDSEKKVQIGDFVFSELKVVGAYDSWKRRIKFAASLLDYDPRTVKAVITEEQTHALFWMIVGERKVDLLDPYSAFIDEFLANLASCLSASPDDRSCLYLLPKEETIKEELSTVDPLKYRHRMSLLADVYVSLLARFLKELGEEGKGWELIKEVIREVKNATSYEEGENILDKIIRTAEEYQRKIYSSPIGKKYIERESKKIEELTKKGNYFGALRELKYCMDRDYKELDLLVEKWKHKVFRGYVPQELEEVKKYLEEDNYSWALDHLKRIEENAKKLGLEVPPLISELKNGIEEILEFSVKTGKVNEEYKRELYSEIGEYIDKSRAS